MQYLLLTAVEAAAGYKKSHQLFKLQRNCLADLLFARTACFCTLVGYTLIVTSPSLPNALKKAVG
jgi:hypothetical protein